MAQNQIEIKYHTQTRTSAPDGSRAAWSEGYGWSTEEEAVAWVEWYSSLLQGDKPEIPPTLYTSRLDSSFGKILIEFESAGVRKIGSDSRKFDRTIDMRIVKVTKEVVEIKEDVCNKKAPRNDREHNT